MNKKLLSVGDFAKRARITLATLHHYDKIGLLSPLSRGENNYRYYSLGQLSEVNLIHTLQESGLSLNEILELKINRTPEMMEELLTRQTEIIDGKIDDWNNARKLITTLLNSVTSVKNIDEKAITVQFLEEERLVLGELNTYEESEDGYDALVKFYCSVCKKHPKVDCNYPVWGLFSTENLRKKMAGQHTWPERYYFYSPDGANVRPAGLYAIGYARGGYGQNDELYVRMRDYISKSGLEVCGDAYEEYPLNEISVSDETNYLMRVMISVCEGEQIG